MYPGPHLRAYWYYSYVQSYYTKQPAGPAAKAKVTTLPGLQLQGPKPYWEGREGVSQTCTSISCIRAPQISEA